MRLARGICAVASVAPWAQRSARSRFNQRLRSGDEKSDGIGSSPDEERAADDNLVAAFCDGLSTCCSNQTQDFDRAACDRAAQAEIEALQPTGEHLQFDRAAVDACLASMHKFDASDLPRLRARSVQCGSDRSSCTRRPLRWARAGNLHRTRQSARVPRRIERAYGAVSGARLAGASWAMLLANTLHGGARVEPMRTPPAK